MTTISSVVASTPTNRELIMQAALAGKLREPDGPQPRGTTFFFVKCDDGYYELRYIKRRDFDRMLTRAQLLLPTNTGDVNDHRSAVRVHGIKAALREKLTQAGRIAR